MNVTYFVLVWINLFILLIAISPAIFSCVPCVCVPVGGINYRCELWLLCVLSCRPCLCLPSLSSLSSLSRHLLIMSNVCSGLSGSGSELTEDAGTMLQAESHRQSQAEYKQGCGEICLMSFGKLINDWLNPFVMTQLHTDCLTWTSYEDN